MSSLIISKNAIANLAGMLTNMLIAFILAPFLVHTLGDTKYGIWTIAVAFTGYMNLFDFGMSSAVNRYVAKYNSLGDQEKVNSILSTALALFIFMAFLIILASPLMARLVTELVNIDETLIEIVYLLIIVVSFDVGIFIVRGLFRGAFAGYQRYEVINATLIISAIYKALMFYIFLSGGYGLIAMGMISISANLLALIVFYNLLKKQYPCVSLKFSFIRRRHVSQIISYSKYIFLAMLANQVIYYSDAFIIGYFLSAAAVTHYSIPWTLSEYAKKISFAISQTYAPAISEKEASGDLDAVKSLFVSGTKYMIVISNLISVGVIILGGAFISIWMGPKYKELGEMVLIILFVNQYFQGPQQISYSVLQGLSKQKYYSYMSVAVSICNLILSIILVQKFGIVGVAIGAVIPQVLFNGLYVPWLTLQTLKLSKWYYFRHTYLISVIPTLILFGVLIILRNFYHPEGYLDLFVLAFTASIFYLISVFYLMLDKNEKNTSLIYIRKLVNIVRVTFPSPR
jgi:O-antigen/teichoic acid export membrane protein